MTAWTLLWPEATLAITLMALGALFLRAWQKRTSRLRRELPDLWPLDTRPIANSEELMVWHWLSRAFYDHHVMIKLPLTRFSVPRNRKESVRWYRLLGGVYCTFTICSSDGRVVGCVDLPGRRGIPRRTRQIKHSLLAQFALPYWVVRTGSLPTVSEIRGEFLGEVPTLETLRDREQEERDLIAAKANLRSALSQQRSHRTTESSAPSNWPSSNIGDSIPVSDLGSQWQENSFLRPLDSRKDEWL